jgi:diguanylate cyclase (GGDEF)-like protein/PAS domain S-box-containing protein
VGAPTLGGPPTPYFVGDEPLTEAELLQAFLTSTPDHVYFKDHEARFLKLSNAHALWLGTAAPEKALGKTDADFFTTDYAQRSLSDEAGILSSGKPLVELEEHQTWIDGSETWVSTSKMPLVDSRGSVRGIFGTSRDITWRKKTELEIAASQKRLAEIIQTQTDLALADQDMSEIMRIVVERTQGLTHADGASLHLLDDNFVTCRAASGCSVPELQTRRPVATTILSEWIASGAPIGCDDTLNDPRLTRPSDREMMERLGAASLVAVPLRHDQRTAGLLQVVSTQIAAFRRHDTESLQLLAVVLSAAMSHAAESEAKREQLEALAQFHAMCEGAPIGIVLLAPDGAILGTNPAFTRLLGYAAEDPSLIDAAELVASEDRESAAEQLTELLRGKCDYYQRELRCRHRNGDSVWTNIAVSLVRSLDDEPQFAIQMIENITDRKRAEEELRRHAERSEFEALHDPLTGLPNRALFHDRLRQALLTAQREKGRFAVMMADLDRFKEVNDSLGHASGDQVLKEVAARLHNGLRATDTVARLGGDEFGLILPWHAEPSGIVALLDKLSLSVQRPIDMDGLPLAIGVSIGVTFFPDDGTSVEDLVACADRAMYAAKKAGARHTFYDPASHEQGPARAWLVGDLERALNADELHLYFQPKVALSDHSVRGIQALLRWLHPEFGLILPEEFIAETQETGLMKPLTAQVLDKALGQARKWRDRGIDLPVSINVVTRNLTDVTFPESVAVALAKWDVPPSRLEIEIPESSILEDPFRTKIVLAQLRDAGVCLSIDHFGTSYCSVSYLSQLRVHELRVDQSFISSLASDRKGEAVVRSAIALGRILDCEVVAEGVETDEIWDAAAALGCTLAQGFSICQPLPSNEFETWLGEHSPTANQPRKPHKVAL